MQISSQHGTRVEAQMHQFLNDPVLDRLDKNYFEVLSRAVPVGITPEGDAIFSKNTAELLRRAEELKAKYMQSKYAALLNLK